MPRLLVFVPCEKVIISQEENNPSLIGVFSSIAGQYQSQAPPPQGQIIALPWRWSVFTLWHREDAEEGRTFEQTLRFVSPAGESVTPTVLTFTLDAPVQRGIVQIMNMPVSESGEWTLELFINERGAERPSQPVATYPVSLHFERVDAASIAEQESPS